MASADSYVTLTGTLLERRDASLRVQFSNMAAWTWIPRRWLEFNDNLIIGKADIPSDVSIRILGAGAEEKGLI